VAWTTPRTWVANEIVTAAEMNSNVRDNENLLATCVVTADGSINDLLGTWSIFSRTTADVTRNASTTLTSITGLSFSAVANGGYFFEFVVHGLSPAAAAWAFQLNMPQPFSALRYGLLALSSAGGVVFSDLASGGATSLLRANSFAGDEMILIKGLVVNSGTSQTMTLQFSQNVSTASTSVVYANSHVYAKRFL